MYLALHEQANDRSTLGAYNACEVAGKVRDVIGERRTRVEDETIRRA